MKKVTIDSIEKRYAEQAYNYVQKDIRPASPYSIGVPIYNLFYTKNGRYRSNSEIDNPIATPPAILDSTLVEISRTQIQKFLKSKGYFNATVTSDIEVKDKKAKIKFKANPGQAFHINQFSYSIEDSTIKKIYASNKLNFTHLHDGMQYDGDSLTNEREQIYQLAKQNGYFDFIRQYVTYDVDTNAGNSKANIKLIVDNPRDSNQHSQFFIGTTDILVAPNSNGFPDTLVLNQRMRNGIRYTDFSKRFRRNPIVRYDFLKEGELYDIGKENLTYDRLYELNIFKNVKIEYNKSSDSSNKVNPIIYLIPQKRMSNRIEGEVPFNSGIVGFNLSNTYTNNNIFRGAERFEFQIKGGLQSRRGTGIPLFSDIYQRDFSVGMNLAVPRLLVPFFKIPILGKYGVPHTTFSTSYLFALQTDFFTRRVILNSITYDWAETKSKFHSVTPLNFEYRFGGLLIDTLKPENRILLEAQKYYIKLLDRRDLTLGVKYTYALNSDKLLQNKTFVYFRGNIDLAGNLLSAITALGGNSGKDASFLGLPYNQYVRPEIDVRWYKNLGSEQLFVARLNAGIGYAYGNSTSIPFEKLFFAGGSNGIRAWQARTVGPGNYNRDVLTENVRKTSYGIDQLGQMHMEANFEYRYNISNKFLAAKLKGAAFLDMGNVWNISAGNQYPETYFKWNKLAQQIAIGTGLGFRYDVDYFVFRLDVGLKLKDPQFQGSDQWVISKFFKGGKEFKSQYLTTHSPDRYRFVQYNFGIGMPF